MNQRLILGVERKNPQTILRFGDFRSKLIYLIYNSFSL